MDYSSFELAKAYVGLGAYIHFHLCQYGSAHKNFTAAKELFEKTDHYEPSSKITDIAGKIKDNERFLAED